MKENLDPARPHDITGSGCIESTRAPHYLHSQRGHAFGEAPMGPIPEETQHPSEQAAEGEQLSHQLLLAYHSQEYAKMILFEADLWPRR